MSKKFKKLLVPEGYRHYWSKYPEGYTILEALLNWVDSVNQLTDNVNDWNIYLDDFVETFDEKLAPTVREMLNEMDQDGRLAEIINDEIFSWKADKTYVDDELDKKSDLTYVDDINTQLTQTEMKIRSKISIEQFGASVTNTPEDNDISIQNAIDSMQSGDELIIPTGDFDFNNLVFNPPNGCSIHFQGRLISNATTGIAFKIGNDSVHTERIETINLNVMVKNINWLSEVTGVQIMNVSDSVFGIRRIYGFYKNFELISSIGSGSGYNKFFLNRIDAGKINMILRTIENGWVNENSFYGGSIRFIGANQNDLDDESKLLVIEHSTLHNPNNNHFYSPSFENQTNGESSVVIGGQSNQIIFPRLESVGGIEFTSQSKNNVVMLGAVFLIKTSETIIDNGVQNMIMSDREIKLTGSSDKVILIKQLQANSHKAISVESVAGQEVFSVNSIGNLVSNRFGRFETGIRWYTDETGIFHGSGTPEGVVTANKGSMYLNRSGSAGTTLYIKEDGTGNTGWVAK